MSLHKAKILVNGTASCRTHLACLGTLCLLAGVLGCNTPDKKKDDPLFGVKPQVNPVPPTTGAPGAQTSGIVPPIPNTTSTGSTAAVASLPGARPLAIGETPTDPGNNPSATPNVQPIPRDAPVNPALLTTGSWGNSNSTQPLQQTPPITPNLPPPPTTINPSDDAQFAPLRTRGAVSQKVDNVADGVRVTAIVPNPNNSGSMRMFEATARDIPAAVLAITQQIDQQR